MASFPRPSLNWLLPCVPAAVAIEYFLPQQHATLFAVACLAIVPLAGWLGRATEQLASRTGGGAGALLNATFGNAAELIIALIALRHGLSEVVKASLTGSILGNLLLVLGAAELAGGVRHKTQHYNITAARAQSTMLTLSAIALVVPAGYHALAGAGPSVHEHSLSLQISAVLLITYGLSLVFALHTHKLFFQGDPGEAAEIESQGRPPVRVRNSLALLFGSTALIAWMSEILVGTVAQAARSLGMTSLFVGVVVVAIIGNAAEHSTAILVARKNRVDLSLGIAIGSSVQVALFVAPVLVFASYWIAPAPMDLVFTPAEVLSVVLAVAITSQIAGDGESHWLEGVQLLAVYLILVVAFYFLPETAPGLAP